MRLIRLLLRTSRVSAIFAVLMSLLSGASNMGIIALINLALRNDELPKTSLAWSFVSFCFLILVTTAASQALIAKLTQEVIFKLRMLLNRRILACPLRHIEDIGSHQLLTILTEDVEVISIASFQLTALCVHGSVLVGCFFYLFWLSVPVFLLLVSFMTLGIFSHGIIVAKGKHFLQLAREEQDRLFFHYQTTIEGIKELKLHQDRRQAFLSEDLQPTAASDRKYRVTGMTIFAIAGSWGLILFFIPIGLLIFVLPLLTNISVPVLSGYALTIIFMITPLQAIVNTVPALSKANIAFDKIEALGLSLAAQTTEFDSTISHTTKQVWKCLEFVGVTHTYRGEEANHFILGPIDLAFFSGELVFIIGGNGSGKSSLVKLLTALYVPETGTIRVDGKAITDENREWYRQHFAVIFSDFYLFERLLGLDNSNLDAQIQDYLVQLQLNSKVRVKDGVLSTTKALSQGQRKRLALLTAYLEDRPIYVFDEWASDQDPVFKDIFYTKMLPALKNKGKTVLVISHDDRYFYLADRILKLEYGQLEYDKRSPFC